MAVENFTKNVMLVTPDKEPHLSEEIEGVSRVIREGAACDVVLDFSNVRIVRSSSLCSLLLLRSVLEERGRRLIFCNVGFLTRCIFNVVGLDKIFTFADDKTTAVTAAEHRN